MKVLFHWFAALTLISLAPTICAGVGTRPGACRMAYLSQHGLRIYDSISKSPLVMIGRADSRIGKTVRNSLCPYAPSLPLPVLFTVAQAYKGTNFGGAAVSVNVLRDSRTEKSCAAIDTGRFAIRTKEINGILFHYATTGGAATSHYAGGPTYHTLYHGVCFEIVANTASVSMGVFDPGTIRKFDSTRLDRELNAIVNTFRFVGPVVDGPAWQVYHNTSVGGSFEYPDGDSVVVSIKYSNEHFHSKEITDSRYFLDHGLRYVVSAKVNLRDKNALQAWLQSSRYPDLSKAHELTQWKRFSEYRAGDYFYIFEPNTLYILTVTDQHGKVLPPDSNRVFRHLLNSFKIG